MHGHACLTSKSSAESEESLIGEMNKHRLALCHQTIHLHEVNVVTLDYLVTQKLFF